MKTLAKAICAVGLLTLLILVNGCKTTDSELSERPWNAPKTWEHGLPSSMTEGR